MALGPLSFSWSWLFLGLLAFLAMSLGGLAVVRAFLIRLPATYFSEPRARGMWADSHPALRWTGLILKNIIGFALVVLGVILALPGVPGPGILTILLGLMLMDFPGKRRLERSLISRPTVIAAVNRLRHRYGREPFVLEHASDKTFVPDVQTDDCRQSNDDQLSR